ncbi:MAG: SDR family oxidoreductase [Anaerolineae bacterium]|nr:SDR family oxidoreductase [Anaerolineae bacterium]
MTTYLVTGGAGFIGSNIVAELLRRNETVRVLDNFSTGRSINLVNVLTDIELIEGDLRDLDTCHRAVAGVDYVLHQAAIPSVPRSVDNPLATNDVAVKGTLNMLLAARDAGVKRFVYASSSSVYGDSPQLPKQETMALKPKSPYAVAKLSGEYYTRIFAEVYGLETVCLRYFNVFGPRQDPASPYSAVIPLFIKSLLAGRSPTIYGDGRQSRDFTFVSNNVEANLLATTAPNVSGQVFNIACGNRFSLLDLVNGLNEIIGTTIEPTFNTARSADVKHSLADIRLAQKYLGYHVKVDFKEGLTQTVAWYKEHHD